MDEEAAYHQAHGAGIAQGIKMERERIIAILERYANAECTEWCSGYCDCYGKYEAQQFIAMINGEKS